MAVSVSNEYKQIIYSGDSRHKIKILFNNVELQDADRYCEKLTVKSRIIPNGAKVFSLNNFISKEAELILHDIDTSIIQNQVSISIGTLVGNSYEYVPIGIFNIQDTPTNDKNKTTIKLRDNSVKFDFNYNTKPLIDSGGGTATKLQILQDICSKAGVTCNITSFIGSTDRIGIYDNTITARQYIADLAEQAGRIATINRSGELIFVNINSLTTWNIPLSIVERYELGKAYRIGKVVYEDAIRKYETASTNYDTLYLDSSNPYISSQSQVNSILQQVNNFVIDSVKTGKILGNPAIDGYDLINIYNDKVEGNPSIFKTLATSDLVYNGVLINTFDTQIGEEERKENVSIVGEATFKKWAKTEIDNINGEVLIQAGKIDNVEKEINPTDTSSGSSIHLEDSAEAELIDFEVEGKTTQETRSGYNLLNVNTTNGTSHGITFMVNEDKSITINGTNDGSTSWYRLAPNFTLPAGTYTLSSGNNNASNNTFLFIDDGSHFDRLNVSSKTFSSDTTIIPYIRVAPGATINNQTIYPMIVEGSYTSETMPNYEQYGVMPSPQYPSELVSVGYENLLSIPFTQVSANIIRSNINNFKKGTYTFSFKGSLIPTWQVTAYKIVNGTRSSLSYKYNVYELSFTLDEEATLQLEIYYGNGIELSEISKPILLKGTQQHSYIPYGKYGIEVETIGKNLLNFDDFLSAAGVSYTKEHNIFNVNSFGTLYSSPYKLNLKLNTKYTLSQTYQSQSSTNLRLEILKNGSIVGYSYATNSERTVLTFTTSNNINDVYTIRINYTTREYPMIFNKPMLEEEIQATEYEPYIGHNNLIVLNEPLRSIGDTKDLLYIKNGMLYVDRKIGSVGLDGSENWGDRPNYTYADRFVINNFFPTNNRNIFSNYFTKVDRILDTYPYILNNGMQLVINFTAKGTTTLAQWKTWLSTHNTEVQYVLDEPYTEELGEVQIPSTCKGITHINTTDELEPNMNITYVRDTLIANYVESHVSELKINEQGIEARVETIEESDYGGKINRLESSITSQEARLDILSTNIDTTTGEVREVTTSNGLKFNSQGLNLYTGQDSYNTLINNVGTYYKDGDNVISETTKDGFMATNSKNKGQHSYSYDETNDLYEFIDERVEADGEYCYATFYNGEE